jgi:hypothetical protein
VIAFSLLITRLSPIPPHGLFLIGCAALLFEPSFSNRARADSHTPPRLNNSHIYHQTQHDLKNRGIDVGDVKLNLKQMLAAKASSVKALTGGIETYLFKKNGVDYIKGAASFASPTQINVALNDGGETQVEAKNVIIATGSEVTPFPGIEIDEKRIVSSTGALDLQEVPKKVSENGIRIASYCWRIRSGHRAHSECPSPPYIHLVCAVGRPSHRC